MSENQTSKKRHISFPDEWNEVFHRVPYGKQERAHPTVLHFHDPKRPDHVVEWHSRRHRKGRSLVVRHKEEEKEGEGQKKSLLQKIKGYKWWGWEPKSITWWVAQFFLWGSVAWVINGFVVWLPCVLSSVADNKMSGGVSALVGGSLFEIGALLALIEAAHLKPHGHDQNQQQQQQQQTQEQDSSKSKKENSDSDKYSHKEEQKSDSEGDSKAREDAQNTQQLSSSKGEDFSSDSIVRAPSSPKLQTSQNLTQSQQEQQQQPQQQQQQPQSQQPQSQQQQQQTQQQDQERKKRNEIGFQGALIQMFAATIFFISTVTGIPGVLNENSVGEQQGLYWTPQVVGGSGFIVASALFMLEVQSKWYKMKPADLGWEVGVWNLIGAVVFTLSGIFGYYNFADKWQCWGTTFSTFWGGFAFLLGSYFQILEAVNK